MRTTLTIEDRIVKELKSIAHKTGKSFKQVVNETLQAGLFPKVVREERGRYILGSVSLGEVSSGHDLDKALALADWIEDAEISRKLASRK